MQHSCNILATDTYPAALRPPQKLRQPTKQQSIYICPVLRTFDPRATHRPLRHLYVRHFIILQQTSPCDKVQRVFGGDLLPPVKDLCDCPLHPIRLAKQNPTARMGRTKPHMSVEPAVGACGRQDMRGIQTITKTLAGLGQQTMKYSNSSLSDHHTYFSNIVPTLVRCVHDTINIRRPQLSLC